MMKSKTVVFALLMLMSIVSPAQVANQDQRITFKGFVVDGPFANTTIKGYCHVHHRRDSFNQTDKCVVKLGNGFRIVDPSASIQVIGSNQALRIVLGPNMNDTNFKGNFKLSNFEVTTYFDRAISLFDIPDYFIAVEASIAGVSIAGGTSTTNPDCLIWDIAGDGVFN